VKISESWCNMLKIVSHNGPVDKLRSKQNVGKGNLSRLCCMKIMTLLHKVLCSTLRFSECFRECYLMYSCISKWENQDPQKTSGVPEPCIWKQYLNPGLLTLWSWRTLGGCGPAENTEAKTVRWRGETHTTHPWYQTQ
jgi:hypothetical protein